MSNLFQLYANRRRHPGTTRGGNLGFYAVIGVAAVTLLVLFGIYFVASDSLQGLASFAPPPP